MIEDVGEIKDEETLDEVVHIRKEGFCDPLLAPFHWLKLLASETHWSFVFGVLIVYGVNQGLGGSFSRVGTDYYMKDVQKVQPSESQVYQGMIYFPWLVKPLWGLLTDVVPFMGYRRRPYFVFAGILGVVSMLWLSFHGNLHIIFAMLLLAAGSAGVAIADVTIDACVAQNSHSCPALAPDMQSLCALSKSVGSLLGFSLSGIFVHLLGPKGVFGLVAIPNALVLVLGFMLNDTKQPNVAYGQVRQKFWRAGKVMWSTLKFPTVWRPCLYMLLSITLSIGINEGLFYWFTDAKEGPSFSQETVGFIFSIGAVGSLLGALLYQNVLKDYLFQDLLFWSQLLFGVCGLLDLVLVLRWNLKLGIPDYIFIVVDESVSNIVARLKWMPLLVISSRLCPPGIEGTFFALLMSIDNLGLLLSTWGGGLMLRLLNVTRTKFDNLWLAIIIRTLFRISPVFLLFLIPGGDPSCPLLPDEILDQSMAPINTEDENVELVALVDNASKSS